MRRKSTSKAKTPKTITTEEFDAMFDRGEDVTPYLDLENVIVSKGIAVRRVNVDFPAWMIKRLDREAIKLNVSRQAVIKMWLSERMRQDRPKASR